MSSITAPKGTQDFLPAVTPRWQAIERIARETAELYHFGEIRTPIWRKGGTMFGPQPRDYAYQLPRKMFRSALRSALAMKLKDNQLNVVDAFSLDGHKTKAFAQALAGLGLSRKILVVDHQENANLKLAARNLSDVNLIASLQVTPYQVLNSTHVVFSKAAIQAIEEVLKK